MTRSPLRPVLTPPAVDPDRLRHLARIIDRIVDALDAGQPVDTLMAEHNALAGRGDIEACRYHRLYASMTSADAATEALMPSPGRVDDITRDELIEIVHRITDPALGEGAMSFYLALFAANTRRGTSDLIFWPPQAWLARLGTAAPTPEQIVDEALRVS